MTIFSERRDSPSNDTGTVGVDQLMRDANVFASNNLCEVRDQIAKTYCPHDLQLASRGDHLEAWLNHRRLEKIGIGAMGYGTIVDIEGIQDEDMLLLMQPLSGAAEIGTSELTIDSDLETASVVDTGDLRRMRWSGDCIQRVVQISNGVLEHHAMMLLGRPLSKKLRFAQSMQLTPKLANCWHYASLLSMELSGPNQDPERSIVENLQTLFIFKLLESHPSNYSEHMRPQPCKIAPHHVRRTEQYILAHADQSISVEQLVEVSEVSARGLFDGFRRFRGTSPMAYLKSIRLERAREDLMKPQSGETVTEIACRWHFYQLGRFSAEYKNMYGELPSETLRKFN